MSKNLLYYNMYEEDGTSELEDPIEVSTYEELSRLVKSNYFCVNLIQKLFTNFKINEIMVGSHNEEYLFKDIYDKLEKENYAKYRTILIDLSLILYSSNNDELNRNLSIISESEDCFERTFLGLEYLLLKKVASHYKKAIYSKYAEKLIDLAEILTNKKFTDIEIEENFIQKVVSHQISSVQSFSQVKSKIESYSNRLADLEKEIEKLDAEINSLINTDVKKTALYEQKLAELKETKKKFVEERLTIFDKTKILFLEIFGFEKKIPSVYEDRENNLKGTFVSRLKEEEESLINNESSRKEFVSKKTEELKKSIEDNHTVKIALTKQLMVSKEESETIEKTLISTDKHAIVNNVDLFQIKSISTLAKENIVFVHIFPRINHISNSPLEEYVEMVDRGNMIRIFNPKLECNIYPIVGADFSRQILEKSQGDYGVLLSRGVVEQLNKVHKKRKEENHDHFSFKDKIKEMNSSSKEIFYEALVDKSELYGYVAIVDNMLNRESDKKIKVSKLIEAFEYLSKFNQHGANNQLKELPMVIMVAGEILEIKGVKFDKYKLTQQQKDMKLDLNQALIFVKKTFKIAKVLNKASEITLRKDTIAEDVREGCASKLLSKFNTYFAENPKESAQEVFDKKDYILNLIDFNENIAKV